MIKSVIVQVGLLECLLGCVPLQRPLAFSACHPLLILVLDGESQTVGKRQNDHGNIGTVTGKLIDSLN